MENEKYALYNNIKDADGMFIKTVEPRALGVNDTARAELEKTNGLLEAGAPVMNDAAPMPAVSSEVTSDIPAYDTTVPQDQTVGVTPDTLPKIDNDLQKIYDAGMNFINNEHNTFENPMSVSAPIGEVPAMEEPAENPTVSEMPQVPALESMEPQAVPAMEVPVANPAVSEMPQVPAFESMEPQAVPTMEMPVANPAASEMPQVPALESMEPPVMPAMEMPVANPINTQSDDVSEMLQALDECYAEFRSNYEKKLGQMKQTINNASQMQSVSAEPNTINMSDYYNNPMSKVA